MGGFGKQKQRSNAIFPQVESSLITGPTLKSLLNRNLWFKIQQKEMIVLFVWTHSKKDSTFESLAHVLANATKHSDFGLFYST